ncbi:MAG: hypothetical protein MZW92_22875 [Comamonadaceae bacterium]|nr:hypothetical protein [Comamonadaceae bacterium]
MADTDHEQRTAVAGIDLSQFYPGLLRGSRREPRARWSRCCSSSTSRPPTTRS